MGMLIRLFTTVCVILSVLPAVLPAGNGFPAFPPDA